MVMIMIMRLTLKQDNACSYRNISKEAYPKSNKLTIVDRGLMDQETLRMVKNWESRHSLSCDLVPNYNAVIANLDERGLIEAKEFTSHGNVRLYIMPLTIYDQLRSLNDEIQNEINKVVEAFEIPF